MDKIKKIIQDNILSEMEKANISMRQLSADINCSESYIQKLLSGDFVPTVEKLSVIADYFEIPLWKLFLSPQMTPDKLEQITAYLMTFDEETLDATLNIVRRMQPVQQSK